jgi:hypothetical protein
MHEPLGDWADVLFDARRAFVLGGLIDRKKRWRFGRKLLGCYPAGVENIFGAATADMALGQPQKAPGRI